MSLWYQAPSSTFEPGTSRSIGWSQVPNSKASFIPESPQDDNPQSSTGGGTLLDLGSSFNIRGPQITFGFDMTMNYADYQFQNVNDLTFNQFQQNFNNTLNDITNTLNLYGGYFNSGSTDNITVLTSLSLTAGGLVAGRRQLNFSNGVYTGYTTLTDTTITTTACP